MTNKQVDLHLHTIASDGTWTAAQAVQAALTAGLGVMAITDHDSIASVAEGQKLALAAGIEFHTGTEMCSTYEGHCFHILGYDFDITNQQMLEHLDYNTRLLEQKDEDSIKLLEDKGWPVTLKEYHSYAFDRSRGGFKSLMYLIDKGLCKDVRDFFGRIFTKENALDFPVFPTIEETIATIHAAGGKALLAHSASQFHGPGLTATLESLGDKPFDGFECYHTGHNAEDTAALVKYCQERKLLISGGSDCHGRFVDGRIIGQPKIFTDNIKLK